MTSDPAPSELSDEFDALMRRAGLTVPPAQRDRLLPGYADLRTAAELLRGRPHTAEPSNIYSLPLWDDAQEGAAP